MLGRDASDDTDVVDAGESLGFGECGKVGAEDRRARDTELLGDRRAGRHVVAGDHADTDVSSLSGGDGGLRFSPGRVDHADEARHLQAGNVSEQVTVGVEDAAIEVTGRGGHDPMAGALHPFHFGRRTLDVLRAPRNGAGAGQYARRPIHHRRRRTFDEATHHGPAVAIDRVIERRHQLVSGIKWQRRPARQPFTGGIDVDPGLVGENEQRALGGVADDLAVDELGVVGNEIREDHIVDRLGDADGMLNLAVEAIADARYRIPITDSDDLDHCHLIHRQRARLVGVDRRRESERLDRRQVLHDCIAFREIDAAQRKNDLCHCR